MRTWWDGGSEGWGYMRPLNLEMSGFLYASMINLTLTPTESQGQWGFVGTLLRPMGILSTLYSSKTSSLEP